MTPNPADAELEDRLRDLLHERASVVGGPAPDLPLAGPIVGSVERVRRGHWVLAVAAAACVALIAAVVAVGATHETAPSDHVVATQPTVPATLGDGDGGTLYRAEGATDPTEAARDFLRIRLGDGSAETDAALRDGLDLHAGDAVPHGGGQVVPVTWTRHDGAAPAGAATSTVWVAPGPGGLDVVGATIEGFDLSGVGYGTGDLAGQVRGPAATEQGTTTRAALTRRMAMPLLEPDAAIRADAGEPLAATVPVGKPFTIPMTASGDLELAVRVVDDATGEVVGLAMTVIPAPSDPDMEGFEDKTPQEQAQIMEEKSKEIPAASESAGCKEAGAFQMPELGGFPTEVPSVPATSVADVAGSGPTPAAAADALASALGITWEVGDVALGDLDGGYLIARLPGGRLVDLTVYHDPDLGAWRVTEARTRGACRDFGGSNATPIGAADPKTTLGLPVVAQAVDGSIWYRTGGTTQRVAVSAHDLSTHWINVAADQPTIEGRITVLRDAAGAGVLVDLSPELNVPG